MQRRGGEERAQLDSIRRWPSLVSCGLLILAAPLFLAIGWTVLVAWPWDVFAGAGQVFSGHDVVQVADGLETGVTLFLLLLAVGATGYLMRRRFARRTAAGMAPRAATYLPVGALFLWVPAVVLLGLGAEYGLQAMLAGQGYRYCTFHLTDMGKGGSGTYVYARADRPGACDTARRVFPPGRLVPDRRAAFDLAAP